jgi:hypothetical protein
VGERLGRGTAGRDDVASSDAAVHWGAFIEVILALAGVGTALALYPIAKRQASEFTTSFAGVSRIVYTQMLRVVGDVNGPGRDHIGCP